MSKIKYIVPIIAIAVASIVVYKSYNIYINSTVVYEVHDYVDGKSYSTRIKKLGLSDFTDSVSRFTKESIGEHKESVINSLGILITDKAIMIDNYSNNIYIRPLENFYKVRDTISDISYESDIPRDLIIDKNSFLVSIYPYVKDYLSKKELISGKYNNSDEVFSVVSKNVECSYNTHTNTLTVSEVVDN